ncbi:MAG: class I SAM-dependent methyltransferase [Actinomycetota bacterium]|nr:class I SAM-dependent methyltransferase [Actinomycetota bacterium]
MLLADQLRSFHRRRIVVPVPDDALVLDVGSGDKPSWRADVLLDRYVSAEHAGQRSGTDAARVTRPLFDAPADDMPFADGAFDYAICSHVLEHVADPAAVVAELTRVAVAGYIEVPEVSSAKIIDFPSHLWWCRLDQTTDPATLVFQAKDAAHFDADIAGYIARSGVERELTDLLDRRFEHRIVSLAWTGDVAVRVDGTVSAELLKATMQAESHHRVAQSLATRLLTNLLTAPARWRRRHVAIRHDDIVKSELRRGDGAMLERRVYRSGASAPTSQSSVSQ